ncbi:MAG: hypothetical protein IJU30_01355 [Lachnospiraceae bacterium]|nr:hypothetical protein [Lachnospiraceae bacterium]
MTRRIGRQLKIACITLLMILAAFSLQGCRGLELEDKTEEVEEYTRPQAMILIANERNRYEKAYSEGIWNVTFGEDHTGLDKLTVQNVKQFMEQLMLLNMLAEERGITVTSQERDLIRQLTDEYMAGLTDGDLQYMGCDRTDVQKLYTDYFTADKLINGITSQVNSEISDSEAKVIKIEQIGTTDLKKAKAILKRVKIDGANFSSMASRYTETDTIEEVLMRGSRGDLIEDIAFRLEEGQISNILQIGEMYYIIKCTDGYSKDATLARKSRLEKALNNQAFQAVFEPYSQEHKIRFSERFWNELDFQEPTESTADNFFDLYERAFS